MPPQRCCQISRQDKCPLTKHPNVSAQCYHGRGAVGWGAVNPAWGSKAETGDRPQCSEVSFNLPVGEVQMWGSVPKSYILMTSQNARVWGLHP